MNIPNVFIIQIFSRKWNCIVCDLIGLFHFRLQPFNRFWRSWAWIYFSAWQHLHGEKPHLRDSMIPCNTIKAGVCRNLFRWTGIGMPRLQVYFGFRWVLIDLIVIVFREIPNFAVHKADIETKWTFSELAEWD